MRKVKVDIFKSISAIFMLAIIGWVLLSIIDVNLNNMGGNISDWNIFPLLMNATESWRN